MRAVLLSTYELGRQPFGLASAAAFLGNAGNQVTCADLTRETLPVEAVRSAEMVAFYLPMHTATRLALPVIHQVRSINPGARLCAFGLYAPLNQELLRAEGLDAIIGGEFELGLVEIAAGRNQPLISLDRLPFVAPDRTGLPPVHRYATLHDGARVKVVGSTEASRGCKHLCRHCPVVPVYNGVFRIVPREIVLQDIRRQVESGAEHITFGDPDFFNGPGHAIPLVEALHREHPDLSYDVTIKIEHLLNHRDLLPVLRRTGCAFVVSAVESVDDAVLARLEKGHTRNGFIEAARLLRAVGLPLSPTFIPFTPWTTRDGYCDLLRLLVELDLAASVAPIQLAIRLLIPAGSRLLDLEEVRGLAGPFDPVALTHRWKHPDSDLDVLCHSVHQTVRKSRPAVFERIWELAHNSEPDFHVPDRSTIPYLNEPWYC